MPLVTGRIAWPAALVALCCCLGALPLLNGNPPATSDGLYHLLRAAELSRQLRVGILYPRWAPDFYLGYGYPIFLFTPLLPYYLVVLVHLTGLPLLSAMNVVEAGALVGAGLLAYAWLRRHVGPAGAACGAILYALAPYHLVNLYYRGDLSEFLAATWFPAILLALDAALDRPGRRRALLLCVPIAALLLTHFLSALLFLPVVGLLGLTGLAWRQPRQAWRQAASALGAAGMAAGLSAFSWLPAVLLAGDVTFAKLLRFYNYRLNFATPGQLFALEPLQRYSAVFAGSHGFGYQFGLLQSIALLAGIPVAIVGRRSLSATLRRQATIFALLALVSLAGCLSLSTPLWTALPPLQLVQFPWRLLAIAALPAAFFAALTLDRVRTGLQVPAALVAGAIIAASALLTLQPLRLAMPADFTSAAGIARFELLYHLAGTSAAAEYLPPWATARQTVSAEALSRATGIVPPADPAASVPQWLPSGRAEQFALTRAQAGDVILPLLYFPGWTATLDGRPAVLGPAPASGLASLPVPAGRHVVVVRFSDPGPARLGDALSLALLAVLLVLFVANTVITVIRRRASTAAHGDGAGHRRRGVLHTPLSGGCFRQPVATEQGRMQYAPTRRRQPEGEIRTKGGQPGGDASTRQGIWAVVARRSPALGSVRGPLLLSSLLVALPCAVALLLGALGGRAAGGSFQALDATLAGGLQIRGYALTAGRRDAGSTMRVTAGEPLQITIRTVATGGRQLSVQLTDAAGTDWADWSAAVGNGDGSVAMNLSLPPALPPGLYALRLGAALPGGTPDYALQHAQLLRLLPVDGTLLVGPVVVVRSTSATAPNGASPGAAPQPPLAVWPGQATLHDANIPNIVAAGTTATLAWTWQAPVKPSGTRLTETIHLVDPAGDVLAAADAEPAAGYYPTPFWLPGEQVLDRPSLAIAADTPPGTYAVRVGMLAGGVALPAQDAAGRPLGNDAVVGQVVVTPPSTPAAWDGKGAIIDGLAVELARPVGQATPGRTLPVALRWHRGAATVNASTVTLMLMRQGRSVGSVAVPLGSTAYPVTRWRPGETELQEFALPVPGDATAGPADLVVDLHGGVAQQVTLGTVIVAGRPHVYTAQPAVPVNVRFADGITLVGYDLRVDGTVPYPGTPVAGRSLALTLYWKAAGPTTRPLKVTVQVLSAAGHLLTQADTEPGSGAAPTTSWVAGEIVTSVHDLSLAGLPAGTDRVIVALYDPATNQRIAAPGGDAVTLTPVTLP